MEQLLQTVLEQMSGMGDPRSDWSDVAPSCSTGECVPQSTLLPTKTTCGPIFDMGFMKKSYEQLWHLLCLSHEDLNKPWNLGH